MDIAVQTPPKVLWLRGRGESQDWCADLLASGAEITEVDNIEEALAKLRSRSFDVVVSQVGDFLPLERAVATQQAQLILENIAQGVCIMDAEGRILWMNARMQAFPAAVQNELPGYCREMFRSGTAAGNGGPAEPAVMSCCVMAPDDQCFEISLTPVISPRGRVSQVVALARDATESRRLQRKLDAIDRAGRELVRLEGDKLAKMTVAQRLDFFEEKIIRFAKDLLHFDNIAVRLLDKKTNRLELIVAVGLTVAGQDVTLYAEPEGNGITGRVAATGESYICNDVQNDPRYIEGISEARSSLTVPIRLQHEVIGTLNVESVKPAAFTEADRQFVEIFAGYLAIAINILDLLVVERRAVTGQLAHDVDEEIAGPVNDIITEAKGLMEEYIGNDGMHARLKSICDNATRIRLSIKQVVSPEEGILRARDTKPRHDPVLAGRKVLVVDDEKAIRDCIKLLLVQRGCEVTMAGDAHEAIDLINSHDFDMVLSDIRMPSGNGYEVFRAARARRADIPVVLMTAFGYDPSHSIVRARQEGLAGVLFKPFKTAELITTLRKGFDPWSHAEES